MKHKRFAAVVLAAALWLTGCGGGTTADYLRRINGRLTLFAALFLAILATVPTVFTVGLQTQIPFAASSILIAVSVVLETKRQLDDLLVSRNYDSIS